MPGHVDISKERFRQSWPGGYFDPADVPSAHVEVIERFCIAPFSGGRALEIGCGGGYWTARLMGHFTDLVVVDVLPLAENTSIAQTCGGSDFTYIEAGDRDYSLAALEDGSIDYVFSFAVFCHFSFDATIEYLKAIRRVCRDGASAFIMFGNWDRRSDYKDVPDKARYLNAIHPLGWFYQNAETARRAGEEAGLEVVNADIFSDHRDTMAHFRKVT